MKLYKAIQLLILFGILIEINKCDISDPAYSRKRYPFQSGDMCLPNYYYSNGLCYPIKKITICPEDCQYQDDLRCPIVSHLCPFVTTTARIPTTTETISSKSASLEKIQCPFGFILSEEKCRKILCTFGEYYNGRCIQAICPDGTVWRGNSCQKPAYITTILEIDNVFLSEAHEHTKKVERFNTNNLKYRTKSLEKIISTPQTIPIMTTKKPPSEIISNACCTVLTPRICKKYGKKWICFNNRLNRCNPDICKHPIMYLKTPNVVYEPPILIMPPNPPLEACPIPNCDVTDIVDCSGCPQGRRELCSTYCYRYICPQGTFGYIDHQDFCQTYPREVGCNKKDGCIWGWCGGNE